MLRAGGARLEIDVAAKDFRVAGGGSARTLENFRLSLEEGEVGALVGPSGCGKTSLLRILAGLDPDFSGSVVLPEHGRLGMAFQEPRLLPWRSVLDNIRISAPDAAPAKVAALLDELGLSEHAGHFPGQLSLGLSRRVALARALAVEPDLLLLDEPLVSLDAVRAAELREKIAATIAARRATTLIVTHDLKEAIALADKIFLLTPRPARVAAALEIPAPRGRLSPADAAALEAQAQAALAAARG